MPADAISPLPPAHRLRVLRQGVQVPASVWIPEKLKGIVLACHGGSGHKEARSVLAIARAFLPLQIAVLAIDGPVHGDRRSDGNLDPATAKESFRAAWRAGVGRTDMAQDFSAALDALLEDGRFANLPIGYVGVSMGTAYGIPFLAADARIGVAAIGLWSSTYPASEHLTEHARRMRCRVWFTQQLDDELFDRSGTAELFEAIGSADKRLVAYPGPHRELEGGRLAEAVTFVASHLLEWRSRGRG